MFKSAEVIGALPRLDEELRWLPVDIAARAITEIVRCPALPRVVVCHIVNPHPTGWQRIIDSLKLAGLDFDTVERELWLQLLEKSDVSPERNPAMKLLASECPMRSIISLTPIPFTSHISERGFPDEPHTDRGDS